uniref:tRNA (uracil-O(2)-)-methyltransferase n=1 Tax=Bursaphelenchus xylophilus TaxID=6326 RepID=A0A1I7RNZ0_BURXY
MDLTVRKSHELIDEDVYVNVYQDIKANHGRELVKKWTERTDPQKYVFEDCGIASYLICLQRALNLEIKCFVDIGCGNGLLTYLLSIMGWNGCGIDARTRKIWGMFKERCNLIQKSLDPSEKEVSTLPVEADFLIGNHSDELTPWIPIMAARKRCNFFLLPCCPHDFYTKFSSNPANPKHGGNGIGTYGQYLNYVHSIIQRLGFDVKIDRLKISSTKKICFVGTVPSLGLAENLDAVILELLEKANKLRPTFKPIANKAEVRNCTKLDYDFKQKLSKKLAEIIISKNEGTSNNSVPLNELVPYLTEDEKTQLKSQCGGIQTFLKNFHQAFEVRKGNVKIRDWLSERSKFDKPDKKKLSKCWFDHVHPNGCPLISMNCPFRHRDEGG